MRLNSFEDLARAVKASAVKSRVAVVAANDAHTVESVVIAQREGLIEAILIGDEALIKGHLAEQGAREADFRIKPAPDIPTSLALAVEAVHSGEANVLMKGKLETGDFMRAILNRENDLRSGELLSVAGFYELERYHKLLAVSDQAINTYPDLDAKKAILQNAVGLLCAIGLVQPKVAVLAAVEKLNPKMKETVDADALRRMNVEGEIRDCIVDGPLSFDIATSAEAARLKGYESEVAGDADLLIVPDLVCGNVLVKALTGFAGATTAGTVLGAKVPVVLVPRSAEASDKFYSIALAAYTALGRA
ncbi:MAG: phosphate butyryltransferase [Coriobacteriales bacterium]|jgi:phosphotransacetylase|nr:phosphate butyryltransferase [Coriobacteriales bacterium]